MSAISTYLHQIITAIWAKDVRQAIHDAISQCYDDVNAPALQTEAMQAAVQAKIDAGEMAALTIADGSLTGAKLANGTIPNAKIADGAITRDKLSSEIEFFPEEAKTALLACFAHVAWTDEHGQDYYDALESALYPNIERWAVNWNYTDGMPQNNGFEIYNSAGTAEMTNNGVLVTAENATDKSYRYLKRYPDETSLFTKDISEIKFVLDHFGGYNTAPYTNGIRLSPGSGVRSGTSLLMPSYIFNNSGVTAWHPTSGNPYNHEVLAPYTFTEGVEYTIKAETTRTDSKVYINDVLVATDTVDKYSEERSGTYFGVSRGASIILKSFRENKEV